MIDFLSIGNISIDIFFSGKSLTFKDGRFQLAVGGKYFVDHVQEAVGGGGANVAIGVAKHNIKSSVYGIIGNNPFKKVILDKLNQNNVSTELCDIEENFLNISTILLSPKGERTIIHYSNKHQHFFKNQKEIHKLRKFKIIYMGNLPDVSLSEKVNLLKFLSKNNIFKVVNLGVADCRRTIYQLRSFLNHINVLIVNGHEFADLVKAPYKDIHFHDDIVNWYIPFLKDKIVVVTEGAKGSFCYYNNKVYYQPAIKVEKIVDTTGCGDGYTAGFISEYIKSQNIVSSMVSGSKYAVKILGKIGAN